MSAVNCVLRRTRARTSELRRRENKKRIPGLAREFIFIQSGINGEREGGRETGRYRRRAREEGGEDKKRARAHTRSISSTNSVRPAALWTRYKLAHIIISISNSCSRAHTRTAHARTHARRRSAHKGPFNLLARFLRVSTRIRA